MVDDRDTMVDDRDTVDDDRDTVNDDSAANTGGVQGDDSTSRSSDADRTKGDSEAGPETDAGVSTAV
jgi:hypothetical protein